MPAHGLGELGRSCHVGGGREGGDWAASSVAATDAGPAVAIQRRCLVPVVLVAVVDAILGRENAVGATARPRTTGTLDLVDAGIQQGRSLEVMLSASAGVVKRIKGIDVAQQFTDLICELPLLDAEKGRDLLQLDIEGPREDGLGVFVPKQRPRLDIRSTGLVGGLLDLIDAGEGKVG